MMAAGRSSLSFWGTLKGHAERCSRSCTGLWIANILAENNLRKCMSLAPALKHESN
jgi:hypothetical protein